MTDLIKVRREILPVVRKNMEREKANTLYTELMASTLNTGNIFNPKTNKDHMENIIDIRLVKHLFNGR